jgi:hypothetical protein
VPILVICRKYYGTKMMLFILAAAGYLTELIFGGLGLIPAGRHARVLQASIQWNYTTVLNIIFLILAAALCYRLTRTGGIPLLKMMRPAPALHRLLADRPARQPGHPGPALGTVPPRINHAPMYVRFSSLG